MLFWLSKTFWIVAAPANFALILCAAGAILLWTRWRRTARALVAVGVAVLAALALLPLGAWLGAPLQNRFAAPDPLPATLDGIVLLGGAEDASMTEARGVLAVNGAADRLIAFVDLARRYPEARLVFSGGSGSLSPGRVREADVAKSVLAVMGLDGDRVVFERESRNTFENARNLKALVAPRAGERWLLVTSAMYMPRAVGVFRKAGWPVLPYPVDYSVGPGTTGLQLGWNLSARAESAQRAMREWIGLVVYRLLGRTTAVLPGPIGGNP